LVRRSTDGGATWSLVDDFFPGGFLTEPFGLTADAAGNIYVAGVVDPGTGSPMIWTVRKGVGGTSFSTVDSFSVNGSSQAQGIYAHPTAGIFAVGAATVPGTKGYFHTVAWVVRRSTNGGATWSTVDTFQLSQNVRSGAFGIGADAHGNHYVAGQGYVKSGPKNQYSHWIVRKSSTGGTSWTTVDNFQLSNSADSAAVGFAADSNGNLYTAGWGRAASSGNRHWIVRKNPGGAGAWSPDDDFQYMSGSDAEPFAITANASGKLFVGGAADSNSSTHWLVRKR